MNMQGIRAVKMLYFGALRIIISVFLFLGCRLVWVSSDATSRFLNAHLLPHFPYQPSISAWEMCLQPDAEFAPKIGYLEPYIFKGDCYKLEESFVCFLFLFIFYFFC